MWEQQHKQLSPAFEPCCLSEVGLERKQSSEGTRSQASTSAAVKSKRNIAIKRNALEQRAMLNNATPLTVLAG